MSRHSLQQWDHYKRQMDQLMARPDFLTNLAQSAGAMSTLVNHMLDPSVSDWSTATVSGKPLLTSQEQVQFKEMLDPYVPHIRAFFNGERMPSTEQHGGAEELVKKMQQQLTKNMTYMGQHNVVMYGGTQIDVLRQMEQQANRDIKGDVTVYAGVPPAPPVELPLRFITTSIVTLFDVIRMISSMVGWERGAEILSVIVSALEVSRGEWKRGITSFMGYFGTKSLWIGQVFKVFVYIFQTIPTAMNHVLLDDLTELGRSIVFGMALNIFQTIAPAKIRQIFINNIDIINENNKLLTQFFSNEKRKNEYKYVFDATDPRYAVYFNEYSWGDLTEFQSYMIEAKCTTEMVRFHNELKTALNEEQANEDKQIAMMKEAGDTPPPISGVGICRSLLGIMGMLPANCTTKPVQPLVKYVINSIIGQLEGSKEEIDDKKDEMQFEYDGLSRTMLKVIKKAASDAALVVKPMIPFKMSDLAPVTGMMSSAFQSVKEKTQSAVQGAVQDMKGKVGNLMPKKPHWREQLKELEAQVKNMDEHVKALPQIKDLKKEIKKKQTELNALNADQSNAVASEVPQPSKEEQQEQQPVQSAAKSNAEVPSEVLPSSEEPQQEPQENVNMRGGRRTHRNTLRTLRTLRNRNRRIRASTRSLRQRARE